MINEEIAGLLGVKTMNKKKESKAKLVKNKSIKKLKVRDFLWI